MSERATVARVVLNETPEGNQWPRQKPKMRGHGCKQILQEKVIIRV